MERPTFNTLGEKLLQNSNASLSVKYKVLPGEGNGGEARLRIKVDKQTLHEFQLARKELLTLFIDRSGSMSGENIKIVKE